MAVEPSHLDMVVIQMIMRTRTARTQNPPTMMRPLQPLVDLEDKRSHPMEMMTAASVDNRSHRTGTMVHQTPDVVQTATVKTPATATELKSRRALELMTPAAAVMVDSSKAADVVVAETMMTRSTLDQEHTEHQEDKVETLAATDKMTAPLVADMVVSNRVVVEVTTTRRSEHEL